MQRNGKVPAPKSVPLQFGSADLGNQTELPEAAGSYGNEPEESTRHHSQSPPPRSPSLPLFPHSSGPSCGSFPGHASLARGRRVPGAPSRRTRAADPAPCASRAAAPLGRLCPPGARPTGSHRPRSRALRTLLPSSQVLARSPGTHQWESGEVGGCWAHTSRPMSARGRAWGAPPSAGRSVRPPQRAPSGAGSGLRAAAPSQCRTPGRFRAPRRPGPGGARGNRASLGPAPGETHRGLSADPAPGVGRLLPPALGQASPLAHLRAPRVSALPPPPPRLTAAGRARGAVPWVTWRFPLGLPNPGTSRVGAGCASVRESTPSPHPSQKGFAKYSWDCLASGLSRKQYIASTRLCSADEGSVALPSQPETKMILFSHSSFALSRSFSSLHPSFLPFSLFMFSCSLFSFSFLSWPPSPFSFFLPLSSSVCFPSLLFLSFLSFSWSDQNDVKSYILYWNSPLPPPDSWESSDVCIWRLGDGEWESHRKNRLRCVSALPTKISYVSGPLSF